MASHSNPGWKLLYNKPTWWLISRYGKIGISLHVQHRDLEFVDNIRSIIQTPISQNYGFKGVYTTRVLTHAQQWEQEHYQMLQTYEKAM
jgi:hypothetical protein